MSNMITLFVVIILINRYDINGDGVVNLEEFLVIMRQI